MNHTTFLKAARRVVLSIAFLLISTAGVFGDSITLAWDADTDTNAVGYVVFYGTNSGLPTMSVDTGSNTYVTVTDLQPGSTYYFSVSAYNLNHVVGPRSGEITYLVPGIVTLTPGAGPDDPVTINFPVTPSQWYEVQASIDMVAWETIITTPVYDFNDWVTCVDFDSPSFPQRFYRIAAHTDPQSGG